MIILPQCDYQWQKHQAVLNKYMSRHGLFAIARTLFET
jgi:hypothetical protein